MLQVQVIRRTIEAEGIVSFELASADGSALPTFNAGAHIDVHIGQGVVRQYSLCSPLASAHYMIAVLDEPQSRGGSRTLHTSLREGDRLQISEPRNHFELDDTAQEILLFAGGIGITPILSMAESLAARGRRFRLHYCGRSLGRMAFLGRLEALARGNRIGIHSDDGPAAQRFDASLSLATMTASRALHVCGPAGFMDHVLATARRMQWQDDQLRREYFAAQAAPHREAGSFHIQLRSSDRTVFVPADSTAAEALISAGIDIPLACGEGVCGTCITRVVAGEPDHRDLCLSDEEHRRNELFTPCCSRSLGPILTLDL